MTVNSNTSSSFILFSWVLFLFGEDGDSVEDEELVAGSARLAMQRQKIFQGLADVACRHL